MATELTSRPRGAAIERSMPPARRGVAAEWLVLGAALLLVLAFNGVFWRGALAGRDWAAPATWRFVAATTVMLTALHALPLLLLATRWALRPLLLAALLIATVSAHMMGQYGVVLDPPMMRNTLRTDLPEVRDLIGWVLLAKLTGALLLGALLWRVPIKRRPWPRALAWRLGTGAALLLAAVAALALNFQDFGSLMRNHKALRYTINPASAVYSTLHTLTADWRAAQRAPEPPQPVQALTTGATRTPRLIVWVVGETARAANWGLNGYARHTTPRLRQVPHLISFTQAHACGTSTEVSLPCLFSPFGRADYDEERIRASESVLQLLARAGWDVLWLDNQSGCKGVCAGLPTRELRRGSDPKLCPGGECLDGVLVRELQRELATRAAHGQSRDAVIVLHQMGNHGPAYSERYPADAAPYAPACNRAELRECTRAEIVNAYDNAIRYTDTVLADTIGVLSAFDADQRQRGQPVNVALLYASDHGESLGEAGIYLHGMPYAIAPREQLEIPMLAWFARSAEGFGVDAACLLKRATQPVSHDNLFHTVLGLADVRTPRYQPALDLAAVCAQQPAAGAAPHASTGAVSAPAR